MNINNISEKEKTLEFKKRFIGFISLLSSGVVAAVGFMLLSSQRWPLLDQRLAVFIILFVQWQTLGFAVSKIGIEHLIFAVVSADETKVFATRNFITTTVIPLSVLFSIAIGAVFSIWAGFVAFGTIILDAYSIIIMADLNARGHYMTASISNFINYPLFFIILFNLKYLGWLDSDTALAAFLASSLLRSFWLARKKYIPVQHKEFSSNVTFKMGVQQICNFLLYRIDQLILAVLGLKAHFNEDISMYVYMAKFPEILAGVIVILGTMIFPKVYIRHPFTLNSLLVELNRYKLYVFLYFLLFLVSMYAYVNFWNGQKSTLYLAPPFLLNALCIIFANNIAYSMLRQGYISKLTSNMALAVLTGSLLSLIFVNGIDIYILAWIVPIQVVTFMVLSLSTRWGKSIELHT